MPLFLVGLGLSDPSDISVKGLELVKKARKVYVESYTGILQCSIGDLEKAYGVNIIPASREFVEQKAEQTILAEAKNTDVVLLVPGDPLVATTHVDLALRAKKTGVRVEVVHNASIVTAVAATGLQVYKFGRTASIPFAEGDYLPETPYNVLAENHKIGAHTLFLLDLRPAENKFLTIPDAIAYLLKLEKKLGKKVFSESTLCLGCARLGSNSQLIMSGTAKELRKVDFGKPPCCLVVPGNMHFIEEEFLEQFK